MKVISYISLLLVCLTLTSCDSIFLKPREFEKEFKNFTSDSDSIFIVENLLIQFMSSKFLQKRLKFILNQLMVKSLRIVIKLTMK